LGVCGDLDGLRWRREGPGERGEHSVSIVGGVGGIGGFARGVGGGGGEREALGEATAR